MTPSNAPAPPPPPSRYSTVAIGLHWAIALSIAVQIGVGWYMGSLEDHSPAQRSLEAIHISFGLTILLLTLVRIAWAVWRRPPPPIASLAPWERYLSKAVHGLFYVMLLAIPLSGWIMESVGRRPILFWGAIWPHFPGLAAALAGHDARAFKDTLEGVHGSPLVWAMVALVGLHVLGALKHQFDGSPVLWRMLPMLKRPAQP